MNEFENVVSKMGAVLVALIISSKVSEYLNLVEKNH